MNTKKLSAALKAGVDYFIKTAGSALFVMGLLVVALSIPPMVSMPIIVGIGIACAGYGAYKKWQTYDEDTRIELLKKAKELAALTTEPAPLLKGDMAMVAIAKNLDQRFIDVLLAEQHNETQSRQTEENNILQHQADLNAIQQAMRSTRSTRFFTLTEPGEINNRNSSEGQPEKPGQDRTKNIKAG